MPAARPRSSLRAGLLERRVVLLAGGPTVETGPAAAIGQACTELGASVVNASAEPGDEEAPARAVAEAVARHGHLDALVVDAAALFGAGLGRGVAGDALRVALDASWSWMRATANEAYISAPGNGRTPGKIISLAPASDAGAHAEAARAGLENMARTLSIEWSRYGIRTVAVAPGPGAAPAELADLVAFLVSAAGDYFSGCRFDVGGATDRGVGSQLDR